VLPVSIRVFVRATVAVSGGLFLGACSSAPSEEVSVTAGTLGQGIAGRVGSVEIRAETIAKAAAAQGLSLEQARDRAIRDALFGLGAERERLGESTMIRPAVRARLARARLEKIDAEATQHPPTDAEVEEATAEHFYDLDRPEGFRVIHAVARISEKDDAAKKAKARAVAERVAAAVASVSDAAEFEKRAKEVATDGVELRVEKLDPVAADGRVLHPMGGEYVASFAAAAARLSTPGQKSSVIETEFGFHVMMLLEKTAEKRVPLEERRSVLKDEILATRARKATEALLEQARSERKVHIERSAYALIDGLQVLTP